MKVIIILLVFGTLLISCKEAEETPVQVNPFYSLSAGQVLSNFQLARTTLRSAGGTKTFKTASATLWNIDSTGPVYGGLLTVDGVTIPDRFVTSGYGSATGYTLPNYTQLQLDGSYYAFSLAGSPGFPALSDSIEAPNNATVISYPSPGDTVPQSSGFTLTWSGSGCDGVFITIADTSGFKSTANPKVAKYLSSDPGTVSITSGDLASLGPGPIFITVTRGNFKESSVGSSRYRLLIYSEDRILASMY